MEKVAAAVVGGGAVGTAVAWQLAEAGIGTVVLLERRPRLGEEQSGHSSGVVHAGIYYAAGTLKARICAEANARMYELCAAHGVPCERVGKLVVAPTAEDLPALEELRARGERNGVPGLRLLGRRELEALKPALCVPGALHVPSTGIVDPPSLVAAMERAACAGGAAVLTGFEVTAIAARGGVFEVTGRRGGREETFAAEALVNAAGLFCDDVGRMVDPDLDARVVPLRGEYFRFDRSRRPELRLGDANVYPVPEPIDLGDERPMMVGAHLTPTFRLNADGTRSIGDVFTVGPEFVRAPSRDDYETGRLPVERFVERVGRYAPTLSAPDLAPDYAGIMVHLAGASDWIVKRDAKHPACVQLLGIDSPGLTCCIEIARLVREMVAG